MKTTAFIFIALQFGNASLFSQVNVKDNITDSTRQKQSNVWSRYEDSTNFNPQILPDFFLLGTLSDYMGRFQYIDRQRQVDKYYPYEEPMVTYLTGYIKEQYHIAVDTTFKSSRHCEMFSTKLANQLNSHYDEKGYLTDNLQTYEQACSFLLGNFYRYGEKLTNKIYLLRFANTTKGKLIYSSLVKAGCDRILYKRLRNIPVMTLFYFEAPAQLIKYFTTIQREKKQLDDALNLMISSAARNPDWIKKREEKRKQDIENFEKAFQ